jgi:hypothetical protein
MDIALMVTFAGIFVAGLAGVLGVWMERDHEAPPRWAYVFSVLIGVAVVVELGHAVAQASEDAETEEATAQVLEKLTELAEKGDNPALEQFVGAELAAQSRANPRMMKRLEKKMVAKGKDPSELRRRASEGRRKAAGLSERRGASGARKARPDAPPPRPEAPPPAQAEEAAAPPPAEAPPAGAPPARTKAKARP